MIDITGNLREKDSFLYHNVPECGSHIDDNDPGRLRLIPRSRKPRRSIS